MTPPVFALTRLVAGALSIGATTARAAEIEPIASAAVDVKQAPSGVQVGEVVAAAVTR